MRGAKAELSQLVHALDLMIEASRPQIASRAVRHAIAMLADQNTVEVLRPAPRPNGALHRVAGGKPNGAAPDDWEPLRQTLHAIYRDCNVAQRSAIAGELEIAPSSLRNFVSASGTPGAAVIARVGQWLAARDRKICGPETTETDAASFAEEGRQLASFPMPSRERHIRPLPNGANGAAERSRDEATAFRDRLRFLIESDPQAITRAGIGLRIAQQAADGASIRPEALARLTLLVRG
jgi:hypothetical protein